MIVTLKKIEARCDEISFVQAPAPRQERAFSGGGLARLWSFAAMLWLSVKPG